MLVTLITPTGARPEAFALLEGFVKNQTYKGQIQWIVIDDCEPKTKCTMGQHYLRGPRNWTAGFNTQRGNMEVGLKEAKGDVIFFLEDDDFYAPTYIETMLTWLKHSEIAGLGSSRYYHVGIPGWKIMPNFAHASLSQTAIRKSLLPVMIDAVNSGEFFFDIYLWRKCREGRVPWTLVHNSNISIGMKGMIGREGITTSHREKDYYYDADYKTFKDWVGNSFPLYKQFLRPLNTKRVKSKVV